MGCERKLYIESFSVMLINFVCVYFLALTTGWLPGWADALSFSLSQSYHFNFQQINAHSPDDIHKLYSGRTVEINNTDAEGRLVLADGVAFAQKNLKATIILDMATLTGAQVFLLLFLIACTLSLSHPHRRNTITTHKYMIRLNKRHRRYSTSVSHFPLSASQKNFRSVIVTAQLLSYIYSISFVTCLR